VTAQRGIRSETGAFLVIRDARLDSVVSISAVPSTPGTLFVEAAWGREDSRSSVSNTVDDFDEARARSRTAGRTGSRTAPSPN
jgi:hypothetical protein